MPRSDASGPGGRSRIEILYLLLLIGSPFLFFWPGTRMEVLLGDGDTFVHTLPVWSWAAEQWQALTLPLWAHPVFSGYPLFAEPQSSVFHPFKALFFLVSAPAAVNLTVLLYYSIAALATYLLVRREGFTAEAGLLAGVIFAFSGFLLGHQAMTSLHMTAASFPLLFWALRRLRDEPTYASALLGGGAILALVLAGHPQMMFYALFYALFYCGHLALRLESRSDRVRFLKLAGAVYVLGPLLSAYQLFPTWELARHSTRQAMTWGSFTEFSQPPQNLFFSLLSTRLNGILSGGGSESMLDVGPLALLLALLGAAAYARRMRFYIVLFILSALLFLGDSTPLYRLMYWVPGYNLFRVPPRNGVAVVLAVAVLAAAGLNRLQLRAGRRWWIGLPLAGLLIFIYRYLVEAAESHLFDQLWQADAGRRLGWSLEVVRTHFLPQWLVIGVFLLSLAAIVLLLRFSGGGRWVAGALVVMCLSHFWTYRNWLFAAPMEKVAAALQAPPPLPSTAETDRSAFASSRNWVDFLVQDPQGWHLTYSLSGGPALQLMRGGWSISGYSPLVGSDYSRLTGDMTTGGAVSRPEFFRSRAPDLLNIRYILSPPGDLGLGAEFFSRFEKLLGRNGVEIYLNRGAPGLFWGVEETRVREGDFWPLLEDPDWNVSRTAYLTGDTGVRAGNWARPLRVETDAPSGNALQVVVETEQEAFLASSHLDYPGWFAWLDGERIRPVMINGLFWGFLIPPGTHRLELHYIPLSFWSGLVLGMLSLASFLWIWKRDLLVLRERP